MGKIKIKIIKLGEIKHQEEWKYIEKLKKTKNSLFEIVDIKEAKLPSADLDTWGYSDKVLREKVKKCSTADVVIGFIDAPIEDNYFSRSLFENVGVVTFYEADKIFKNAHVSLKNYILHEIYNSIVLFYMDSLSVEEAENFFHKDTRGCLFDMCGIKEDIIIGTTKPKICYECEAKIRKHIIPKDFLENIKKELKRLKKPLYYRITDWIKGHPILSMVLATLSAIVIDIGAALIYDVLKLVFTH